MSASLVGSEMCIRDRRRTARTCLKPPQALACPSLLTLKRRPTYGGAPVSYTHLTLPTICSV
eukprot:4585309-Alexandrium_andersonii.AAC.1